MLGAHEILFALLLLGTRGQRLCSADGLRELPS